jgi:aminomethyltransferase
MSETALRRTPLYDEHVKLGGKIVPFAGYEMPVQYPSGILTEHNWTRENAGLFDVSHMGQCFVMSPDFATSAAAMEKLVPADIAGLAPRQQRYSQLLNDQGGILDDLMITRAEQEGWLYVVVNAGCKDADYIHIAKNLPEAVTLKVADDLALLALQGPKAEDVLARHAPAVRDLKFMHYVCVQIGGTEVHVSRSGYTGEDGFELSLANKDVVKLWQLLLSDATVKPIGLGARDSLRLEAGLCLYGHELDETTSPNEAALMWSIAKRRREGGGFIGATRVQSEIAKGTSRVRVGIKPEGRAPAREGTVVQDMGGRAVGKITSGGFGPTVNGPVAMGYVETASSAVGTPVQLIVRDKALPATVVKLPFVPNRFKR